MITALSLEISLEYGETEKNDTTQAISIISHTAYETNTLGNKSAIGKVGNCINLHSNAISESFTWLF